MKKSILLMSALFFCGMTALAQGSALRTHGDVGFSHLYIVETSGQAEGDLHDVAHHVFLGLLITATVQDDGGAVEGY